MRRSEVWRHLRACFMADKRIPNSENRFLGVAGPLCGVLLIFDTMHKLKLFERIDGIQARRIQKFREDKETVSGERRW
jgi:hypothetical protein